MLSTDRPDWLDAHLRAGHAPDHLAVHGLRDREGQAAVARLVAEREQLTQQISEREQVLQQRIAELEMRERQVARVAASSAAFATDPALSQWLQAKQAEVDASPDPDAAREQLGLIREFMEQLGGAAQRMNEQREAQERAHQQEQQRRANVAYIQQHLDDFRDPSVSERVKVLVHQHGFSLEEAHRVSLNERVALAAKDAAELKAQAQKAARERLRPTSARREEQLAPPAHLDAVARDQWYAEHPEARARRLAEMKRKGVGYGG